MGSAPCRLGGDRVAFSQYFSLASANAPIRAESTAPEGRLEALCA